MTTSRPKLFLIDASNVFFRGYSAAPELTAPDGFPTGGTTLVSFKCSTVSRRNTVPITSCWSLIKGRVFAVKYLKIQSAQGTTEISGISKTMGGRHPLCEASGYPYYRRDDGFEADDVIGTFAMKHKTHADVFVYSNDKDFAQLVDDNVTLLQPQKMGGLKVLDVPAVHKEIWWS